MYLFFVFVCKKTFPLTWLDLLKGHPKHHSLNQAVAFPAGEAGAGFVATAPGEIRPVFTLCHPCQLFESGTLSYYNLVLPLAQSCWHLFLLTTSVITWPGVIIVHSASLENEKVKKKVKMESESASPDPTTVFFLMSTVITWLRTGFTRTLALEQYLL